MPGSGWRARVRNAARIASLRKAAQSEIAAEVEREAERARTALFDSFVAARAAAIAAGAMWRRRQLALVCIVAAGLERAARKSTTANVSDATVKVLRICLCHCVWLSRGWRTRQRQRARMTPPPPRARSPCVNAQYPLTLPALLSHPAPPPPGVDGRAARVGAPLGLP